MCKFVGGLSLEMFALTVWYLFGVERFYCKWRRLNTSGKIRDCPVSRELLKFICECDVDSASHLSAVIKTGEISNAKKLCSLLKLVDNVDKMDIKIIYANIGK